MRLGTRRDGTGADGLGEIAAGLVSQGLTILDSVRQNLGGQESGGPGSEQSRDNGLLQLRARREKKSADGPVDVD